MEFFVASDNLPFAVSIAVMVIIGVLEGAALLIGVGFSNVLENLLPDLDVDADFEGPDLSANNTLGSLLTWLRVGRVPLLILLILYFLFFGLAGVLLQGGLQEATGWMLPWYLASIPAFVAALFLVRWSGAFFERFMPGDETTAVSSEGFVGRVATVVLGTARRGAPAQAKLRDQHGLDHYLMVEPDDDGHAFDQGVSVLIVRRVGATFYAIPATEELTSL